MGTTTQPASSPYLPVRDDWLARRTEAILEPELPIVDPHHHLWDRPGWRYMLDDLLAEAFAAGTPVVASDIAGYRDVVSRGVDGLLVPRGDATALAETLRAVQPDRALAIVLVDHDLELVADIARGLGVPAGVVVNRDGIGDERVDSFCSERGLPILLRIPMERRIAEGLARGKNLIEIAPERSSGLSEVLELVMATVSA